MNVDPTAIVSKKAQLGKNVTVGAYAKINAGVVIGDDCYIGDHSVIGASPFDEYTKLPDITVKLEEFVWIGCHTTIQSGTVNSTIIRSGSRVNHSCNLGHDTDIGNNSVIGLASTICGKTTLGADCVVGPGSTVSNRVVLGTSSRIGIGSLVLHDVANNTTVIGRPAVTIKAFRDTTKKIRQLTGNQDGSLPIKSASGHLKFLRPILKPMFTSLPLSLRAFIRKYLK